MRSSKGTTFIYTEVQLNFKNLEFSPSLSLRSLVVATLITWCRQKSFFDSDG